MWSCNYILGNMCNMARTVVLEKIMFLVSF